MTLYINQFVETRDTYRRHKNAVKFNAAKNMCFYERFSMIYGLRFRNVIDNIRYISRLFVICSVIVDLYGFFLDFHRLVSFIVDDKYKLVTLLRRVNDIWYNLR